MASIDAPQNERSRATRTAILDAAWGLLEGAGGPAVTMAATARAAGITRQGLYLHFASRGQLFLALFDHVDEVLGLESALRPMREAPDALAELDAFADFVASYHLQTIRLARAVDRCRHDDEDAAALWDTAMAAWYGGCRSITTRLAAEGRLAEPWTDVTAADLLWALMQADVVSGLTIDREWSADDLAERLKVVLHRTVVTGAPS